MNVTSETLSVREAAERRRSIRRYLPDSIDARELDEILRLTGLAPSAFNLQPWRFVVVNTPEVKARLAEAARNQAQVASAPTVIVLYTDMADALASLDEVLPPGLNETRRTASRERILAGFTGRSSAEIEAWGAEQGNIALGYLLLTAEAHGYQTSAMLGFDADAVKRLLGLRAHVRIPALVAIGRGAEAGFPHHRHAPERVTRAA